MGTEEVSPWTITADYLEKASRPLVGKGTQREHRLEMGFTKMKNFYSATDTVRKMNK